MADTSNSAAAVPAATVVVARDGASGLEVLLVQRSEAVSHMGGMWVFPGGKVDPQDAQPAASPLETARAAAIRETREEVGLEVSDEQLRSRINGASYRIGELELVSLQALRDRVISADRLSGRRNQQRDRRCGGELTPCGPGKIGSKI